MPAASLSPRFPLSSEVPIGDAAYPAEAVLETLVPYLSDRRRARLEAVVAARTFSVLPVLERVHDPGNLNAVLRSAEGLGYGAAAFVDLQGDARRAREAPEDEEGASDRRMQIRASQGAHKWVDATDHASAEAFAVWARARGYRIAVTALRADARPIAEWDFSAPTALVMGAEHEGASGAMLELADAALLLPLDGFVQSYNVSVAAALGLYHARADRLARTGRHGDLSAGEARLLLAHYAARAVPLAAPLMAHAAARTSGGG